MGLPRTPQTMAASAGSNLFKVGPGNLIRADVIGVTAGAGNFLCVYDVASKVADSAAPTPLWAAPMTTANTTGTLAVGVASIDFKETALRFNFGCLIAINLATTPYSLSTAAGGYITAMIE